MSETEDDVLRTEMRVRRALGLGPANGGFPNSTEGGPQALAPQASSTRPRHPEAKQDRRRFVQDGEVPVVVVRREQRQAPNLRVMELEAALAAERAARGAAARALEAAHAAIQSLQTRLTHAELAHAEAMAAVSTATAIRAAGRLATMASTKPDAELTLQQPYSSGPDPAQETDEPALPTRLRRPGKLKQPKPVRWWASGFRAGKGTG